MQDAALTSRARVYNGTMNRLLYIVTASALVTSVVMSLVLWMKNAACSGVLATISEGETFSGPCASDGNGFIILALGVFVAAVILVALNLWVIRRIKV